MDSYERAALKIVNKIRNLQGKESLKTLLKGNPSEPEYCPIANSIDGYADDEKISFKLKNFGEVSIEPDSDVIKFIDKFDDEEYPHLLSKDAFELYEKGKREIEEYNKNDRD